MNLKEDMTLVFPRGETLHLLDSCGVDRDSRRVRVDRLQIVAADHRAETPCQRRCARRDRLVGPEHLCGRKRETLRARGRPASPCRQGRSRESRPPSGEAGEEEERRLTWPKGARSGISWMEIV